MAFVTRVATAAERHRPLPADGMVPGPSFTATRQARVPRWRRLWLTCGILAAVLYVAMTLFVGMLWDGYSAADQTVSELSAIGAPTRPLWMLLGTIYSALMTAFGWVVWTSARPNSALRVLGAVLMMHAVFGSFWPPMHQRAVLAAGGASLTDTLHVLWTVWTGLFFMLETGFGAAAFGKRFRLYSIVTIGIVLTCGAITGTYTSRIQADLPTPWAGAWERVNIAAYMGWIATLAIALLRRDHLTLARSLDSTSESGRTSGPRMQ